MSNVWETRHRLFSEELQQLAEWLCDDEPRASAACEEQTVRLLAMAVTLLRQHQVNKRGQCQLCGWTRWRWNLAEVRAWLAERAVDVGATVPAETAQGAETVQGTGESEPTIVSGSPRGRG